MRELLNDTLGEQTKACLAVGNVCSKKSRTTTNLISLLVEESLNEVVATDRGAKEAEAICDFNGYWRIRRVRARLEREFVDACLDFKGEHGVGSRDEWDGRLVVDRSLDAGFVGVHGCARHTGPCVKLGAQEGEINQRNGNGDIVNISRGVGDGSKPIITSVTGGKTGCGSRLELNYDWAKDPIDDEGGEETRERATLVGAFFHGEIAPGTIGPTEVDITWLAIE